MAGGNARSHAHRHGLTQKMHINDGDGSVAMLSRRHHLFCCRDMSASMFHDMFHSSTRLLSSRRSSRQLGR